MFKVILIYVIVTLVTIFLTKRATKGYINWGKKGGSLLWYIPGIQLLCIFMAVAMLLMGDKKEFFAEAREMKEEYEVKKKYKKPEIKVEMFQSKEELEETIREREKTGEQGQKR